MGRTIAAATKREARLMAILAILFRRLRWV
jgi:hypothetical protein